MNSEDELAAGIGAALRRISDGSGAWALRCVYRNRTGTGLDRVFCATQHGTGRRLAVKCNADPQRNRLQFEALAHLRKAMPDCVAPLWLAPDAGFYVMEWIAAPHLLRRMQDADRLQAIAGAARWLRGLHDRTAERWRRRDDAIECEQLLPPQPCPGHETVRLRLEDWRRSLRSRRGRRALLHTDFQLHNLFDSGGRIIAFDPVSRRMGYVGFDLARFLIGAEMFRGLAAIGGRPWPGDAATDRRVFLEAYGGVPSASPGLFDFVEALQAARLWHRFASNPDPDRGARNRVELLERMLRRSGVLDAA